MHPSRTAGVEVKGQQKEGALPDHIACRIAAIRVRLPQLTPCLLRYTCPHTWLLLQSTLYGGPLVTPPYGAATKTGVWGTFSSLPHGGRLAPSNPCQRTASAPRVVLTLYADKALTKAWEATPKTDGSKRLARQPVDDRTISDI